MSSYSFEFVKETQIADCEMIFDTQFNPTRNNVIALATIEGNIHMFDINAETNGTILSLKKHHKGTSIRRVRFANDHLLISAAKTVKIFDLNTGTVIRKIPNTSNNADATKIYSLLVVDNYLLCTGDDEGTFKLWDYRVDRGASMEVKECEDYISDMDIDSNRRVVVATSGEGTLSAFNVRAKRLEPPQSELFDAGFQCVRYLEGKSKVVVGAEDGALNIFNIGEWGNISDRFPIRGSSTRGQGSCSVDNIEVIDDSTIITGTSDGKVHAVGIFPNKILCQVSGHDSPVESLTVNRETNLIVSTRDNIVRICKYTENENEDEDESEGASASASGNANKSDFFSDLT